jgi:magnesium transporter
MRNQEILKLLELQKSLTFFNASLRSNGAVLDKLMRLRTNSTMQPMLKYYEEDEDLLEDVSSRINRPRKWLRCTAKFLPVWQIPSPLLFPTT